jgi:hypothetical protein
MIFEEFLKKNKYLKKDSIERKNIENVVNKLPKNNIVLEEILNKLKNNNTKYEIKDDIKNSYYVYLNDTIYLSSNKNSNNDYRRICLIAHECIHSLQSKFLQKINFISSNLEMIFFVFALLSIIFNVFPKIIFFIYLFVVIIAVAFRTILENDAIKKSVPLAKEYIKEKTTEKESDLVAKIYKFQINLLLPLFYLNIFFGKTVRVLLIYFVMFFKNN